MSAFYERSEPVTVTTMGFTENGELVSKVYYVIKLTKENRFLRQTYRLLRHSNWTTDLRKAVMFNLEENAVAIAKENFTNVTIDI